MSSEQDKKRSISNRSSYDEETENGGGASATVGRYVNADAINMAPEQLHSFQLRFFVKPVLCAHCRDYIWGPGHIGYGCAGCGSCVHTRCHLFVAKTTCQLKAAAVMSGEQMLSSTLGQNFSIESWTLDNVKEWLAVINLHRYAELFSINKIDGKCLLRLDSNQLLMYRVRDSYHHRVIFECRDELVYRSRQFATLLSMKNEQNAFKVQLVQNPYKADRHFFLLHTIAYQAKCHMCARPFLGIVHQAMLCQNCGLMVHRQCSCNGLPDCTKSSRPRFVPTKHFIFGVSLFDFAATATATDAAGQENSLGVPPLLVKALETIEKRAYSSHEDLYDVYRLSSDTTKIEQIKAQLNENGVELTQFERYDLNTIAAIVKSFLRDLQDSVIPEELYEKLVESVDTTDTAAFQALIKNSLHPQHLACLKFIMAHLIRVWTYQYLIHNCRYLPDKIFHIFRSILIRPPWEKITKIVYNIDKQSLIIQRLMLECDWGVEIPEYKQRPNKPPPPPPEITVDAPGPRTDLKQLAFAIKESASQLGSQIETLTKSLPKAFSAPVKENLNEMPWYWPDLNRDDSVLVLKNCPDGSFLVRNSTDKNNADSSPLTLCVVKSSLIKSIKIFKETFDPYPDICLYDIEKPCRFETVQALITYYSNISLREYNHNLDIILTNGVSKYKFGKTTEWTTEKLYSSFKSVYSQLEEATRKCDELESRLLSVRDEVAQKEQAVRAFTKILDIYKKQESDATATSSRVMLKQAEDSSTSRLLASQLLPKNLFGMMPAAAPRYVDPTAENEMSFETMMKNNQAILTRRIQELNDKRVDVERSIDILKVEESQLQEQLDSLKPELIELRKKRENYHMWLLQRGENDDKIQTVLKPTTKSNKESVSSSHSLSPLGHHQTMKSSVSMSNLDDMDGGSSVSSSQMSRVPVASMLAAAAALSSSLTASGSTDSLNKSPKLSPKSFAASHLNSLNWYRAECDREQAVAILKSRPNGTYLVRPSSNQNSKYVVSLVHSDQIKHLLIEEDKNGCYLKSSTAPAPPVPVTRLMTLPMISVAGASPTRSRSPSASSMLSTHELLNNSTTMTSSSSDLASLNTTTSHLSSNYEAIQPALRFKTLTELVTHYSSHSLRSVNPSIDINLLYPAFYNQQQQF